MHAPALSLNDHPTVAVITPIYKHSVLVSEAVESVLTQETNFPIHIVLVNDGCMHAETEAVCLDYALTYPEQVTYLRKANGGLSSARNHGIDYTLKRWPSVEAIYLLDADNRLRPKAIKRAMTILFEHPECDWVYPNVDMFGLNWAGDYGGDYSLLVHTAMNICEAGSMIRRRVLERGVRFDEAMRLGYEDWDFFLCAAEEGFRGRNLDTFGFRYRKRPESMLADSHRDDEEIKGSLLRKHKALISPRNLVRLEQEEAPRYAFYLTDEQSYVLTVDPNLDGRRLSRDHYERLLWAFWTSGRFHAPAFLVVTTRVALEGLKAAGVLHWLLWRLEDGVRDRHIATASFKEAVDGRYTVRESTKNDGYHLNSLLLMISPSCFADVLRDKLSLWINSLVRPTCDPLQFNIELECPVPNGHEGGLRCSSAPVYMFLALLHELRASAYRSASQRLWDWRSNGIPERHHTHNVVRRSFGGAPAYPRITSSDRHIGFMLPLVEFGGVEKVALHTAAALRARGWIPHLVVLERASAVFSDEWRQTFETINFLMDESISTWNNQSSYHGTVIPAWAQNGKHARALGLLYWMDAVVNCHGAALHGLMGQLRRLNVKTIASLHLNDITEHGRAVGNPYLTVAYEHAYDLVTTCSLQLANWCHGMGIPEEKIIPVVNAPGYPLPNAAIDRILEQRRKPSGDRPLRALFLGRLDRQKGCDRLAAVVFASKQQGLPVQWRIVGKAVVSEGEDQIPPELKPLIEPPATTPEELTSLYEWADVLVMLSYYEGLPLTVLEAMRLGVAVVATDVGAVGEVIRDSETGFLLDPGNPEAGCIDILRRLQGDQEERGRICRNAAAFARPIDWQSRSRDLADWLDEHAPIQPAADRAAKTGGIP
ncbi:glycosyltransferase [Niveispirillum fermenti]|uniref:glycosyltransferase n=1 Tax=Niveispirillum fermenti TaxID=1233113 RepID=UPI004041E539